MAHTTITLHLPFPPTVNMYYRHVGHKVLLSANGRTYRKRIAEDVLVQWPRGVCQPLEGRLRLWVEVFPPDHRSRDLDNLCKSLQDALQHACVFADDNQIDDLRLLRRGSAGKPGSVRVMIAVMGTEAQETKEG